MFVSFFVCLLCLLPASLLFVVFTFALLGFLFLFFLCRWLRYVLSSLFTLLPFLRYGVSALLKFRVSGFSCLFCSASAFPRFLFRCFCVFASSSHLLGSPTWGSGIPIRLLVAPTLLCPGRCFIWLLASPSGCVCSLVACFAFLRVFSPGLC